MAVLIYLFSKIKSQSFYCGRKPQGRAAYGKNHTIILVNIVIMIIQHY